MRLSRIYASKLYLTSPRKDQIRAAIADPRNMELVQQLSDALDEESKKKLDEIVEEKEAKDEEVSEAEVNNEEQSSGFDRDVPDESNVFSPSYSGSMSIPSSGPDDFGGEAPDTPEGGEGPAPEPAPAEEPVEESTAIYGEVTAATDIDDVEFDIANEVNVIKGTLNGRAETAGIQRIAVDDKELWIYYEDKVNIGDIMVDVIEALNASAYTYLTFSRLARSNNAIVFDITSNLQEPIKSIQDIEEENK